MTQSDVKDFVLTKLRDFETRLDKMNEDEITSSLGAVAEVIEEYIETKKYRPILQNLINEEFSMMRDMDVDDVLFRNREYSKTNNCYETEIRFCLSLPNSTHHVIVYYHSITYISKVSSRGEVSLELNINDYASNASYIYECGEHRNGGKIEIEKDSIESDATNLLDQFTKSQNLTLDLSKLIAYI